ncbi:hypothetical protein D3C76_781030 [compost metagenome]
MLQADLGGVLHLFQRAAEDFRQPCGGHCAGRTDLALAADLGAGNRRVQLAQHADGGGRQQVALDIVGAGLGLEAHVVVQYRRDDTGGAVGRCGHHPAAGGVLLVHCQRPQIHPVHGAQGAGDQVAATDFVQQAQEHRRAAAHLQPAGQYAFGLQAALHAGLHLVPDMRQRSADFRIAAQCALVGPHQVADPRETVGMA